MSRFRGWACDRSTKEMIWVIRNDAGIDGMGGTWSCNVSGVGWYVLGKW